MNSSGIFSSRYLSLGLIAILVAACACVGTFRHGRSDAGARGTVPAETQAVPPLSANDVSWLFPAPTRAEDFVNLIAVHDLTTQNPQDPAKRDPVWPDPAFQQFVAIANGPAAQVAGTQSRIGLPAEAQSIDAWFIGVVPIPKTNNLNPITCKSSAVSSTSLPVTQRAGYATAGLFVDPPPAADKAKEILDVIADPAKSHFFNTDCVSCHTETRGTAATAEYLTPCLA